MYPVVILSEGLAIHCETEQKTKGGVTEAANPAPRLETQQHHLLFHTCTILRVQVCSSHFHSMHDLQVCSRVPLKSHNNNSDKGLYNVFKVQHFPEGHFHTLSSVEDLRPPVQQEKTDVRIKFFWVFCFCGPFISN